jgi:hypothetical protein
VIGNVAGFVDSRQRERDNVRNLQRQQAEAYRQTEENAALQRAKIAGDAEKAEKDRLQALRRAVGRQRANFGVQGTGSEGGSAQAVLLGLFDESEDERLERERLDRLRFSDIDLGLDQQRRLNVLQLEQLRSRQSLGFSNPYDFYTSTIAGRRSGW